jgi:hypothetical protein
VFFVNGFGDQLMALPAMRALGAMFPGGIQLLLGEGMLSFFYRGLPIGEAVRVWWGEFEKGIIDVDRIARSTKPCDLFLCLSTPVSPSVLELSRKMDANWTVGHLEMFDQCVPVDNSAHMFDQFFSIPNQLQPELRFDDFSFAPTFSPAAERAAERFVRERVAPGESILFVHPETLTAKMWSPAWLSWVLEHFLDARSNYTVFLSSVLRYPLQVRSHHQHRVVWVDEHLELALAILKHADLFLGIDSCFLHAADLFRIAGIGLFGPTDPYRFGFRLSPRVLSFWGKGRMEAIRPKAVLDSLLEIAEGVRPHADPHATRSVALRNQPR